MISLSHGTLIILTVLGYTLVAMIAEKCGIPYNQVLRAEEASEETQDRVVVLKQGEDRL